MRVEYQCADGTPFPVEFEQERDVERSWQIDLEHVETAKPRLADELDRLGTAGGTRAYDESGMKMPSSWTGRPWANGYGYFPLEPMADDELAAMITGCQQLLERHGSALGVWHDHCLPGVRAACAWLQSAPPGTPAVALADERDYALQLTMVASMVSYGDTLVVTNAIRDLYGDDADLVTHELAQGYESQTLLADAALWRIGRMEEGSAEAEAALEEWLATYGWQTSTWSIATPTWHERIDVLRDQVRMLASDDAADPLAALRTAAERRERRIEGIQAQMGDEGRRADLRVKVDNLAGYVPIREDRALWQLIAEGSLRHAVLRRGRELVERGVLDRDDDVFHLTAAEFDDPTGDVRAGVKRRRAENDHWRSIAPPLKIGAGAEASAPGDDSVLRGRTGSRGEVTGTARVIVDLADADRLQPGDVLVCTTTSPPWTPLFAVASAVVSDGGDIASHVAVAAREYGIPCVVGTQRATVVVPDGARIRVNGDAATVEILQA